MSFQVISADSHINEPPDLWTADVPSELADLVPRVVPVGEGEGWQLAPGLKPRPMYTWRVDGETGEFIVAQPVPYTEVIRGSLDPAARLVDMDIDGVAAEVIYPSYARLLAQYATAEVRAFCAHRYNEWIADFESHAPDRLVGLGLIPPLEDGAACVAELRHAVDLGLRGVFIALKRDGHVLSHPDFDDFWRTAAELGVTVNIHTGSGDLVPRMPAMPDDAKLPGMEAATASPAPWNMTTYLSTLVFSGLLDRYADLRIVLAEAGIGWLPAFLERMEFIRSRYEDKMVLPSRRRPTEVFREQIVATFQEDAVGLRLIDLIGEDNVMWGSDYPHIDTTWPRSAQLVKEATAALEPAVRDKVAWQTCRRVYGF